MTKERKTGIELICVGRLDSSNENLINLLKDNGYYIERRNIDNIHKEYFMIYQEVSECE